MLGTVVHESCGAMQPIVGRSVSVAHGSFTSQLLVNISEDLFNRTIECANNSGQIIGSKQIDAPSGIVIFCMHANLHNLVYISIIIVYYNTC
jgi:hypothetical protein